MNFNKGAKTKGRGTSFKGALTYYLHDKDTLETAHRVGFVEMLNLFTDDPHDTWREMMVTCEAARRPETPRRPLPWRTEERQARLLLLDRMAPGRPAHGGSHARDRA